MKRFPVVAIALFNVFSRALFAQENAADPMLPMLEADNVSWNQPGPTSAASMPLGNGDIGLNAWVEPDGDLGLYIGKSDAWADNEKNDLELWKIGGAHVSVTPNPLARPGAPFLQMLKLHEGEIRIDEGSGPGAVHLRVWVDANHPAVRIEATSGQPVSVKVVLDDWRKDSPGETILADQANQITWYHRNAARLDPHVANLTFGATIRGAGLVTKDPMTLVSAAPATSQVVSIYPLTAQTDTPDAWLAQLQAQAARLDALDLGQARREHQKWWDDFWHRSWVFVRGNQAATDVTRGYVLQHFIIACAGRGAYPVKFNGSIFVIDDPALPQGAHKPPLAVNADFRRWGGLYWFQNTRLIYWPQLAQGDFDMMQPLFRMYRAMLPGNEVAVEKMYHHGGAYFAETAPFWGGLGFAGPAAPGHFTRHYFTPLLELTMMMLDYHEYTGDEAFARDTLVPIAADGLAFFDQHFARDPDGRLLLNPDNAIETFWKVHDPAPDIAGLRAVLPRLLALPDNLVDPATRAAWKKLLAEVPPLPRGEKNGVEVLLPYAGPQTAPLHNKENPELYAVFPFRLFGVGRPDLQLALDTFRNRSFKFTGGWSQDPIQAALLGRADLARDDVSFNLTDKARDLRQKFPAFWASGNDYTPQQDGGCNGMTALQDMILQPVGRKILLLPAWPAGWDADFKLHAPFQTTVQGRIVNGKLTDLVVTPPERRADVVDMSQAATSP